MSITLKEKLLIKKFLSEYKKLMETQTGNKFHPRHLAIISQPDMHDITLLEWVSYSKWFDEIDVGFSQAKDNNIIEVFLDIPIHIIMQAEKLGKQLLSEKDQKKLAKALKLVQEIKVGIN